MKQLSKPPVLSAICAVMGLICFFLRQWLLGSGIDQKGLLLLSHPVNFIIWILVVLAAAILLWLFFSCSKQITCTFPNTPLSAVSSLFFAAGCVLAAVSLLSGPLHTVSLIACVAGLVSVSCTLLIAYGQFRGQRMHPLLYCPGVVFFMCFLIAQYSRWSAEPQPQYFFFQMAGCVCLLLSIFCRAELAAGRIAGRNYLVFSRGALFLCIGAIARESNALMYLCFAVALLLDGCRAEVKAPKTPELPQDNPSEKSE